MNRSLFILTVPVFICSQKMTEKERTNVLLFDTLIGMEDSYMEWLNKLSLAIDYIVSKLSTKLLK